jgi:uncharacterized protein (TIGR02757 family)
MQPGRRLGLTREELRASLDGFARRYDRGFLDSDPLGMVRDFDRADDRELVGLLAAALAYGRVESIRASLREVLSILGPRPSRFLESFDPARDGRRFAGFRHRFTGGSDLAAFLHRIRRAREIDGSLEAFFVRHDPDPESAHLGPAMDAFADALHALGRIVRGGRGGVEERDGARWLLTRPRDGSACKRHCLYLRWMVRPEDGLDCGVWRRVSPARLVAPLDVHMARISRALGWTRRRSPSWAMAVEVTEAMRQLDPDDPTRYDFALSRLGILGVLRARNGRFAPRDVREALRGAQGAGAP